MWGWVQPLVITKLFNHPKLRLALAKIDESICFSEAVTLNYNPRYLKSDTTSKE
jgi:hypothetical protein